MTGACAAGHGTTMRGRWQLTIGSVSCRGRFQHGLHTRQRRPGINWRTIRSFAGMWMIGMILYAIRCR